MKVRIVCYEDLDLWILGKFALKMCEELCALGIDCDIAKVPDLSADINHHIIYYYYDGKPSTTDTVMITHIDADWKLEQVRGQMQVAQMGICMSEQTVQVLAQCGIPREKLCYVLPAHDEVMKPRPLVIGITSKVHGDGRKREAMLTRLVDFVSPEDFMFKIMGAGWDDSIAVLRNHGFAVEYHEAFDYELNKRLVPTFDYYLYMGLDEGAMGFIDALAAGVPTIATPQGYHLAAENGITHPFVTFEELVAVLEGITATRRKLTDSVASWTWRVYALKHLEIWEYLLFDKRTPNTILSRQDGFASIAIPTGAPPLPARQGSSPRPVASKKGKRVMIACSHFWPSIGGLENRVEQFGSELVKAGYEVTVMTSACNGRDKDIRHGIRILSIDPSMLIDGYCAWPYAVRKAVISGDYDTCILIQDPLGQIIWTVEGAISHSATRLIIQPIINADGFGKWKGNAEFSERLAAILREADVAVAMTKTGPETQFMALAGVTPVYLPNATKLSESAGAFRRRYAIPEDRFLILHVANLYWVKNHLGLINALHDLPDSWQLVMIGCPSGEPECAKAVVEKLAQRPDVLYIPGLSREWVASAMAEADIVVLSSFGEGAPNTILEAMAHGKPWMATPQCGAANEHAGGIICPLEQFVENLEIVYEDPSIGDRLGALGRQHWQECLSWPKVIEGWIDLIEFGQPRHDFAMPASIATEMAEVKSIIVDKTKGSMRARGTGINLQEAAGPTKTVNIGMVTFNRLEFTRQAIDALLLTDFPYAFTVVDNNSVDGTREYLLHLKEAGVVKNLVLLNENVGVAKASNLAWSLEPQADYYLKLDNDIVVQKPGWLSAMIQVIDNIPEVWALGYNFEPKSYPLYEINGYQIRPKSGNIGGACFLVPRRAHEKLGFWCEDYGLYGEEDFDYGTRISLSGMYNAYMADEDIGMHLPAGRAASIDEDTYGATDGVEESHHAEYRLFKDEQRRGNMWGGRVGHNVAGYQNKTLSLYQPSIFADKWLAQNATNSSQEVIAATASFPDVALLKEPVIKVVILSLDGPDSACARIRLRAPMDQLLETLSYAWAVSVIGQECSTDLDMIDGADLIVVQRFYPRNGTAPILERALNSGKPVIYEADDFLFELPDTNHLKPWAGETAELLEKLLPRFSAITVSTPQLKEEFSHFQANVFVLPNMVEDGLFRNISHRNGTKITIGYCGTNTHARDLELIDDAVFHIAQNYGDKVEFVFMGYAGKHHAKLPGFRYVDFELDYQSYAQKLAGLNIDIALIPIEDNRFNRCKSNIKWLEYSACGYAGIYADLAPYNTTIEHGRTGLLVGASSQQWYKAVSMLIENDYLRRFIAANARTEVLSRYSLSANAHKWLDAYRAIVLNHTVAEPASQVKVSIIVLAWNRPGMLDQCLAEITSKIHFSDSYELIVGDNGSAVDAQEVLAKYKIHKLIRRETNEGLELYKDLYAVAAGDLIIEIDDDVIELPLHFDLQMARYLDEFPDYGLIGLDVVQNEHSNGAKPDGRYYESEYRNGLEIEQGPVVGCCMAVRRSLFNSFGGFSGEALSLTRSQDWVLADRVHGAGLKTGIISGIKCLHACGPYYASLYGDISQDVRKYRNSGLHELADNYDSYAVKRSSTEKHAPPASIIIPVFNKVEYSRECIKALTANTREELYELILVDNGSTDATGSFFETLPKTVKIIKNDTNQGFAKACNQGARAARSNFLLFLNNDTEPQAGWLEALLHAAEQDSNIAAAGSKLLFPDGTIQHAGVIIADDRVTPDPLVGKHIYYGFPADHAAANTSRVYQALTAACLLVRRDAFEAVQGFDEGYWNGYEDVDLCFKLGQKGWTLIYQPASVIVHHESKSGSERFAKAAQNIQRLHEKWLGTIQPDLIIHPDAKEQWQGRAASAATTAEPLVSIVIPLSNQAAFTRNA